MSDGRRFAVTGERSVAGGRWIWLEGRAGVAIEQLWWPAGLEHGRSMGEAQAVEQGSGGSRVGHDGEDGTTAAACTIEQVVGEPLEKLGPRHTTSAP